MRKARWISTVAVLLLCLFGGAALAQTDSEATSNESQLVVEKHRFGLAVIDREIQDEIDEFHKGDVVHLWMRVEGGPADPILVTWSSGDFDYVVELGIGGSPWRTWARKTLFRAGEWTVRVTDAAGNELLQQTLNVMEAARSESMNDE